MRSARAAGAWVDRVGIQCEENMTCLKIKTPRLVFHVRPIAYRQAQELVMKYHYSQVMPKLTKMTLGLFSEERLVGACTLGWGVRPEHTIRKIFPTLASPSLAR